MSNSSILRLQRELLDLSRSPDTQVTIAYSDANVTHMHALMTGPVHSVYTLGMFDFMFDFPLDYPTNPPKVLSRTIGSIAHPTRFNPNIYSSGKVCLSILGTWRGEPGEQWSAAHGVLSILISIQSLLSDNPYLNEPGFENESNQALTEEYNRKILHETIRITVCDRLEKYLNIPISHELSDEALKSQGPMADQNSCKGTSSEAPHISTASVTSESNGNISVSETDSSSTESVAVATANSFCTCQEKSPFEDLCKRLFLVYYYIYQETIDKEIAKGIKVGQAFVQMRFENRSNGMYGVFDYPSLKSRLENIYKVLRNESNSWIESSKLWIASDTLVHSNLRNQFSQIQASEDFVDTITISLESSNPYVWNATFTEFGGTVYEDGMFPCRMVFHDDFPNTYPRVEFLMHVFHPNVSVDGVPFYRVTKPEDIRQHLQALRNIFINSPDPNPATHVNSRASQMFQEAQKSDKVKKDYNRNCRRCAQKSIEG